MKHLLLIIVFFICIANSIWAQSFPNPATLSTGQGTPGSLDPLWVVSPWYTTNPPNPIGLTYNPALINNNCAPGSWVNPSALAPPFNNGNWITGADGSCASNTNDGYRYFRLTINLPADCNGNSVTTPGSYTLYLAGYVDNTITDIFVNGASTGISGGGFSTGTQLHITLPGPWQVGINFIDIQVYNYPSGGGSNPYGLLLVADNAAYATANGDGDGVLDAYDLCPCTPGALSNGCPASITGDTIICKGESTTLTSNGVGTYLWNTGATTQSITVSPTSTGPYYVLVSTSGGYVDSSSINVTVNPLPIVEINGPNAICNGATAALTATGGGTYQWNTNETGTSINIAPSSTSIYKVIVTNSFTCVDSASHNLIVNPKPQADFTFANECDGISLPFSSTSTIGGSGVLTNWLWSFGDMDIDSGSTVSHTYGQTGVFTTTLIALSDSSCADTITHQVTVFNKPVAVFTFNNVCFGDSILFTNGSTVNAPATIDTYLWDMGDNSSTSNQQNPTHLYSNAGSYLVSLIVTTTDGCADTLSDTSYIYDPPLSGFAFNNTCLVDSAFFSNTSSNPALGTIANWAWNFGDATPINTSSWNAHHLYSSPGTYEVTLVTHSSNLGCADTIKDSITIYPMPVAQYLFADVCLQQTMSFYDTSVVSSGTITNWSWNFGDSTPLDNTTNPNHNYSSPGTYSVALTTTTNDGCIDTVSHQVVVHPLPVAQFSTSNVCDGDTVYYMNNSTIAAPGIIQTFSWSFGDGSTVDTTNNASHLFSGAGSYNIQLLTVSSFGCKDSLSQTTIVNPNPLVSFQSSDSIGCEPLCINFQNTSTISSGINSSYLWTFGDGSVASSAINSSHCFTNDSILSPVFYAISLEVTSENGCVSMLTKNNYITVYPKPQANFTTHPSSTTIANPLISLTDESIGTTSRLWNWGDGDTTVLQHPPTHEYADTGHYAVTLIASTTYNCMDTAYRMIIIEPDFNFYIPTAFSPNGDGINDTFIGKGIFINEFEMMIFDRWGNLLYKTENKEQPWDGKANNGAEMAQTDVYIYSFKITDFAQKKHIYRGTVTLVK